MITVTVKELLEFAKSKNPDDIVAMYEESSSTSCGCLMVQYGRENFKHESFDCGIRQWHDNTGPFAQLENYLQIDGLGFSLIERYTYNQVVEILEKYLNEN